MKFLPLVPNNLIQIRNFQDHTPTNGLPFAVFQLRSAFLEILRHRWILSTKNIHSIDLLNPTCIAFLPLISTQLSLSSLSDPPLTPSHVTFNIHIETMIDNLENEYYFLSIFLISSRQDNIICWMHSKKIMVECFSWKVDQKETIGPLTPTN